jgi:hypothetical protein
MDNDEPSHALPFFLDPYPYSAPETQGIGKSTVSKLFLVGMGEAVSFSQWWIVAH